MGIFNDIGSAAGAAGDIIQDGANAVADTMEDVVDVVVTAVEGAADTVDQTVGPNPFTPVIGGLIGGFFNSVRDVARTVAGMVRDIGDLVGAVLNLDAYGAFLAIVDFFGRVAGLVVVMVRWVSGGYFVGSIIRQFEKSRLRTFVRRLISSVFSGTDAANALRSVGLTPRGTFGFPMPARHVVMMIDSATFPGLLDLHEEGVLNLYTLSGHPRWEVWPRARTEGAFVNTDGSERRLTSRDIDSFIISRGTTGRLRFFAMTRQAQDEHKRSATRIQEQLGIRLVWENAENFSWFRDSRDVVAITTRDEYEYKINAEKWLVQKGLKTGGGDTYQLVVVGAFRFDKINLFGITVGQTNAEGPAVSGCSTPGRDDLCCVSVNHDPAAGTAVFHRDVWPSEFFRYVLSHEIGHYAGLCHFGHNSPAYNMWSVTSARTRGLGSQVDVSILHFYLANEPFFTFTDAKNSWRYLLHEMSSSII